MGIFSRKKPQVKTVPLDEMRQSLSEDKAVFLAIIVSLIKKHRKTLENKFEQHIEHDDYGNILVNADFKNEIVYFSDKVVLPELEKCIENGKTKYKDVMLIVLDIMAIADKESMPMDIRYDDSDEAIVDKLLLATNKTEDDSLTDSLLLRVHNNDPAIGKELNGIANIYMQMELTEPYFGEKIESPMGVSYFVASVFMIFSVMYNNQDHTNQKRPLSATFTGNDPYKYEEYIKTLLQSEGFNAKRTKGSGDFGVDVIASKNGKTYAIQCKLYNHTVGAKAVQEIAVGRIHYRTDFAIVVSDNSFTNAAKSLARTTGVILAHHKDLLHKIERLDVAAAETPSHDIPESLDEPHASTRRVENATKAEKQWTKDDADELITVVLPTIRNDG